MWICGKHVCLHNVDIQTQITTTNIITTVRSANRTLRNDRLLSARPSVERHRHDPVAWANFSKYAASLLFVDWILVHIVASINIFRALIGTSQILLTCERRHVCLLFGLIAHLPCAIAILILIGTKYPGLNKSRELIHALAFEWNLNKKIMFITHIIACLITPWISPLLHFNDADSNKYLFLLALLSAAVARRQL